MGSDNNRGNSPVFPLDPSADLADGESYYINTEEYEAYKNYVPYDWIKVTNNSGYRLDLALDGQNVSAVFGRSFVALSGRKFQSFRLTNSSGSTILKETVQVLIQKQGSDGWSGLASGLFGNVTESLENIGSSGESLTGSMAGMTQALENMMRGISDASQAMSRNAVTIEEKSTLGAAH